MPSSCQLDSKAGSGTLKACSMQNTGCPKLKKARYNWTVTNKCETFTADDTKSLVKADANEETKSKCWMADFGTSSFCSTADKSVNTSMYAECSTQSSIEPLDYGNECDPCCSVAHESHKATTAVHCGDLDDFIDNTDFKTENSAGSLNRTDENETEMPSATQTDNLDSERRFSPAMQDIAIHSAVGGVNEPLQYAVMPTGKWLLEYSLMRAELDNDINKALESLRHLADNRTANKTYVSKRISLETAGIFHIIEEKGLKTSSSRNSSLQYCPKRLCQKQPSIDIEFMLPLAEAQHRNGFADGCITDSCATANPMLTMPQETGIGIAVSQCHPFKSCSRALTASSDLSSALPSSSFVIDQAVSAVISERGIHL